MRTALSRHRLYGDALVAARLFAVTALSLFFIAGIMPAPSHAQALPHAKSQERRSSSNSEAKDLSAQTLFNQGLYAEREGKNPGKAIAIYEQVIQRFGRASTPGARLFAAKAQLNKGSLLEKRGETREAISTYERIERNFGNEKTLAMHEVLASMLVSKAEAFYKLEYPDKSIATYAQLGQQFSKNESDFIRRLIDVSKWRIAEIRATAAPPNGNMTLSSK